MAYGLQVDVADRAAAFALAQEVKASLGTVSILVNNAGIGGCARLGDEESAA